MILALCAVRRPPSPCLVEKYVSRSSVQKKSWLGRRAPCHAQAPVYQACPALRCTVEISSRSADFVIGKFILSVQNSLILTTVSEQGTSRLAQPWFFRLFMNAKSDTYLLWLEENMFKEFDRWRPDRFWCRRNAERIHSAILLLENCMLVTNFLDLCFWVYRSFKMKKGLILM